MKIEELLQATKKCNTFIDWMKTEIKLKVLDCFMEDFKKMVGQIIEKKDKIIMKFFFRENQFVFCVTNFYLTFKIDNIFISRMSFLQDYKYKTISTRDIYKIINSIACGVQESFDKYSNYADLIKKVLSFGERINDISINNIKEFA